MAKTLIKNGYVVSPNTTTKMNVVIENGVITELTAYDVEGADQVIDAQGKYLIPGLIDSHMHIGWPDWELVKAYQTDTMAGAKGGVTTVVDRVTLPPGSIEDQIFGKDGRIDFLEKYSYIDAAIQCCIYTLDDIKEIPTLVARGITGFKFYIAYRGSEAVAPIVGIDDGIIFQGFKKIGETGNGAMAQIHAENIELFFKQKEIVLQDEKLRDTILWADMRPNYMELEAIIRCAYFAKVNNCPMYIVHLSTQEGPDLVKRLQGEGIDITVETCPQYLVMNKYESDRILSKVNPPIRTKEDNEALWKGIRDGVITNLGSDHAPCSTKHKQEFWSATVGMSGIETMLPVMLSEGVNKGRISMEKLVEISSYNNAKVFKLLPKKGLIDIGYDADIVMVDKDKEWVVRNEDLSNISDFTPYEGWTLKGKPVMTMLRGEIIMQDGEIKGKPGFGQFVPASTAKK